MFAIREMNKVQKVNAIDEKFILCGRVFWGFERRGRRSRWGSVHKVTKSLSEGGRRRRRGSVQLSEVAEVYVME